MVFRVEIHLSRQRFRSAFWRISSVRLILECFWGLQEICVQIGENIRAGIFVCELGQLMNVNGRPGGSDWVESGSLEFAYSRTFKS